MAACRLLGLAIVMALGGGARPAWAGDLGAMRSEAEGSGSSRSGSSGISASGSDSNSSSGVGSVIGDALAEAYVTIVRRLYTRYPYADGGAGFVRIVDPEDRQAKHPISERLSGTLSVDGAYLGTSLGRAGVGLELMVRRFGVALDVSPHVETAPLDALSLGSASAMSALVLLPRWQLYAGVGLNVMIDGRVLPPQERTDAVGVNGTFRSTLLPVRPVVLRTRFDVGRLGASLAMFSQLSAGAMIRRTELFAGYEARRVGRVTIHGPAAGLRMWF